MTVDDAVAGIAATITSQGLKCHPVRDGSDYPEGVKVSDARMKYLEDRVIERGAFHGEWNYAILPVPRPVPEPDPEPGRAGRVPQDILNHPALTGMAAADVTTLAAALQAQFEARLQLGYRTRHGHRARARRSSAPHGNRRLDVTDYLLALRLRDHLNLPQQAIGALLGVSRGTISSVLALAGELTAGTSTPLPATAAPPAAIPRTPGELLSYAAAAGIPLTLPENGQNLPADFKPRKSAPPATRPKQPNK